MENVNTQLGIIGYSLAALVFFIVNTLQIIFWRKRLNGPILFAYLMVSVLWAGLAAYYLYTEVTANFYLLSLEILRYFLAFLFLIQLAVVLNPAITQTRFRLAVKAAYGSVIAMVLLLFSLVFIDNVGPFVGYTLRIAGHVLLAIIGLLLLEQVFRQSQEYRWELKYLCFGFLAMFGFDFYLYTDALLFNQLDLYSWQARGYLHAVSAVMLGIAISRSENITASVSASRSAVFYTTSVIIAALYLIIMSLGGFYLRAYGGDWGKVIAIVFLFSAFLGLLIILYSGAIRARLRVFIDKHFLEYKYDYREQWLGLIRKLSASPDYEKLELHSLQAMMDIM